MFDIDNNAASSDQLLDIAEIFARGVLRLHKAGHVLLGPNGLSAETALEIASQDLAIPAEPSLSVLSGKRGKVMRAR